MDRLEKVFTLYRILVARRTPVGATELASRLECDDSTVYRVADDLRDHLGAPIKLERGRGWTLDRTQRYELPGLWFNASELHALLVLRDVLHESSESARITRSQQTDG